MRQPIETVPKDGRAVILEDDSTGTYELARWSAQESAWVGEDAKPCNIAARYWHTMRRAEHREDECQPKNPLQPSADVTDVNGPELPDRMPEASAIVAVSPTSNSETAGVAHFYKPILTSKADLGQTRHRFAIFCGAAMIAASLTCMYFRQVITTYPIERADQRDKSGMASVSNGTPLPIEQSWKTTLASTLLAAEADEGRPVVSQVPIAIVDSMTPGPGNQRAAALGDGPAKPLEVTACNAEGYSSQLGAEAREKYDRPKEPSDTDNMELRRSLQHAQDKILNLENEVALLRQHNAQASLSPRHTRVRQRRLKNYNPPAFFGIFNSAPYRPPLQHTARSR